MPAAARRSLSAASFSCSAASARSAAWQASAGSSAVKMASTPSPISFSTSPPAPCTAEIDRFGIVVEQRDQLVGGDPLGQRGVARMSENQRPH